MLSAEFDTHCHMLGLSFAEVSAVCALAGRAVTEDEVRQWTTGHRQVPQHAVTAIASLHKVMRDSVDVVVRQVTDAMESGPVALFRYQTQAALEATAGKAGFPLGAHATVIGWTAEALRSKGIEVEIEWAG